MSNASRKHDPVPTQQKMSGRLRSEKAARDRYAVRGYASTVGKHGADALTVIRDAPHSRVYHRAGIELNSLPRHP
jgi:hypothetical protein